MSLLDDAIDVAALRPLLAANALGFGLLALVASVFHLGRPLYAFRAVLGLRHSWLSREIVAFGLFAGLATAYSMRWYFIGSKAATALWTIMFQRWQSCNCGFCRHGSAMARLVVLQASAQSRCFVRS